MGAFDLQTAVNSDGCGEVVCTHATLGYQDGTHQVVKLDGRFDSGEPFSVTSEPFIGDPSDRARDMAAELRSDAKLKKTIGLSFIGQIDRELTKEVHIINTGYSMSTQVKSLAETIRTSMAALNKRAQDTAASLNSTMGDLNSTMEKAEGLDRELKAAAAELNSVIAPESNGAPEA